MLRMAKKHMACKERKYKKQQLKRLFYLRPTASVLLVEPASRQEEGQEFLPPLARFSYPCWSRTLPSAARLAAETTAFKLAVTMFGSMPTP